MSQTWLCCIIYKGFLELAQVYLANKHVGDLCLTKKRNAASYKGVVMSILWYLEPLVYISVHLHEQVFFIIIIYFAFHP